MKGLLLVLLPALVGAARPPEALESERAAADAEVRDLERRARALSAQAAERRERLRRRVRALYKLSSGGYLRLLAGAGSADEIGARDEAARRVLRRDLEELAAVRDEARTVDELQSRRAAELARALELGRRMSLDDGEPPTGLAALAGALVRPVDGPVVGALGPFTDGDGVELARRGIELASHVGEPVRAIAPGTVRWAGEVPGLGRGVVIDHGDEYLTLTARLVRVTVAVGDTVGAGARLGVAAGPSLYLELTQRGAPIDPAPWLAR
jgi:septal ring factor EnvC (AmiA/AmiB activator)